jgi:hypothetical protein
MRLNNLKVYKMGNEYFETAYNRTIELNYQKVSIEDISGSHLLLFLEHFRLRAQFAYIANIPEQYMNGDLLGALDPSLSLENNKYIKFEDSTIHLNVLYYLNFEYYKEEVAENLKIKTEELKNPYEPMLLFIERGGWYYFVSAVGFYIGEINIRKPQYEFMLQSPPYVKYDHGLLDSYDEEFNKDKDNFIKKYIKPSNLGRY